MIKHQMLCSITDATYCFFSKNLQTFLKIHCANNKLCLKNHKLFNQTYLCNETVALLLCLISKFFFYFDIFKRIYDKTNKSLI